MGGGVGVQGRQQRRQPHAQCWGGRTQLHRDENSKCGWVAREQLLWEQARRSSHTRRGHLGVKSRNFQQPWKEDRQGGGMGTARGLLLPLHRPGVLMSPSQHCLGCGTLAQRSWGHQHVSGVCHTVSVALWAACGQALSVVWKGLCPPPAPPLPSGVPALAFVGCVFPIPVPAVGEQGLGTGVLVHSWSHRVWVMWTQQGLGNSRRALGVLGSPGPCPEPWGCGGSTGTRFSRVKDALSCCLGNGSSSSPPCGSGTAPPPASPRCCGEGEGSSRPPVLVGPEAWLPLLALSLA